MVERAFELAFAGQVEKAALPLPECLPVAVGNIDHDE
jgi:hypothetical protein